MLYPLLSAPRTVQPIWGGERLAAWLALPEPRPERLGEVWLVYRENLVSNGPLAGRSLAELAAEYGAELVGTRTLARYGAEIPLLAKFIDAADRLSIQVHPDDEYAHRVEAASGFHGKTEAWYILAAEAGADVTYGFARPSSADEVGAAAQNGTIEGLLGRVAVQAGDTVFVPAGTVHAINAGVMLFEIQQSSDLTYRVYDYQRRDAKSGQLRELHLAKALEVLDYRVADNPITVPQLLAPGRELLANCVYFALERLDLRQRHALATDAGSFELIIALDPARLVWADQHFELVRGATLLLPANLGSYQLDGEGAALRCYVPE